MNPKIKKIVLVVQDLMTKEKEVVAVLSGDVHYVKSDAPKKTFTASFQMLLDDNKDFARAIKAIANEALALKEKQDDKPKSTKRVTK